jgi:hypothetical protein
MGNRDGLVLVKYTSKTDMNNMKVLIPTNQIFIEFSGASEMTNNFLATYTCAKGW